MDGHFQKGRNFLGSDDSHVLAFSLLGPSRVQALPTTQEQSVPVTASVSPGVYGKAAFTSNSRGKSGGHSQTPRS